MLNCDNYGRTIDPYTTWEEVYSCIDDCALQFTPLDPTTWNEGRCYVPDGETLGPQMKDNIDLFGLDWIKYWSPNAEHNNGGLDSPKTTSAAACCQACESTPDCNMWTWTKSQQGCYLKKSSEETTYVERFDEGRVSGGWDSSVHLDTNTFFDGDATSTTVQHAAFNNNGVMVDHENAGELHTAATSEGADNHDVDHLHRRLEATDHLQRLTEYFTPLLVQRHACGGAMIGSDFKLDVAQCRDACLETPTCNCMSWNNDATVGWQEGKQCRLETGTSHSDRGNSNYAAALMSEMPNMPYSAADHLQGIDYPSEDFVKFSNGRPEARTPAACGGACMAFDKCEYWSWSHNDPQASCYLKSNFAMADKSYSYGYPVRTVVRMLTALSAAQPPSSHHRTSITSSSSPSLTTDPRPWRRVGLHARRRRRHWRLATAARSGDHPSQELRVHRHDQAARGPEPVQSST